MNKTIEYFKMLSAIPRESKNEGAVADFLVDFANKHNFFYIRDSFNNVLIKKGSNKQPIILQSHTDMVCVKDDDYDFNFATMPLKLVEKDDFLSAYKTSLGADNGIGVAMILSLLDSDNNYSIEALFTTDEEVTMTGATNFDYNNLSGNKLISLDGFSSKQLINGCASICDSIIKFNPEFIEENNQGYEIIISGLKGGHSGADINKNVGNAINILTDILLEFKDIKISNFKAGKQFNFIPNYATATFTTSENIESKIENISIKLKETFKDIKIEILKTNISKVLLNSNSIKLLKILSKIKTGVICKNVDDSIILSQNLSSVDFSEGYIKISMRAHNKQKEDEQILFLKTLAEENNFYYSIFDRQSGLIQDNNTLLTSQLIDINKKVNNEQLQVLTQHVSLEGAIFKQKKPDLDIVIVSPDIYDVHSTKERVYIPSIFKTYNLLENFLKQQQ